MLTRLLTVVNVSLHDYDSVIGPKYCINIIYLVINQNLVFTVISFLGLAFFILYSKLSDGSGYRVYKVYSVNKNRWGVLEYAGCQQARYMGCTRYTREYRVYEIYLQGVLDCTGCTMVYGVYKLVYTVYTSVYRVCQRIQGYTGCTRVYGVYTSIQGIQEYT